MADENNSGDTTTTTTTTAGGENKSAGGDAAGGQNTQQNNQNAQTKNEQGGSFDSEKWIEKLSKDEQEYVRSLRSEAAYRRKDAGESKAKAAELQGKLDEIETAKLKEQNEFKKLYEGSEEKISTLKESLIEKELSFKLKEAGALSPKVLKIVPRDNIRFSESGEILGIDEAIAQFKSESPDLFKQAEQTTTQTQQTTSTSAGKEPPKSTTAGAPNNWKDASDDEYAKAKREFLRS